MVDHPTFLKKILIRKYPIKNHTRSIIMSSKEKKVGCEVIVHFLQAHLSPRSMRRLTKEIDDDETFTVASAVDFIDEQFIDNNIDPPRGNALASLLGVSSQTISDKRKGKNYEYVGRKKNRLMTDEEEEKLALELKEESEKGKPFNIAKVRTKLEGIVGHKPQSKTINAIVQRNKEIIKIEMAKPQESKRMYVLKSDVERYFEILNESLAGVPIQLVANVDECGVKYFTDARAQKLIVSTEQKLKPGVNVERSEPHLTVLACIFLNGTSLIPLFIVASRTERSEWYADGLVENEHVNIVSSTTGFINELVWNNWVKNTFLPNIRERRIKFHLRGKPAVLVMDNASMHCSNVGLSLLSKENVRVITMPPSSSHFLQALDVVSFSSLKSHYKSVRGASGPLSIGKMLCAIFNSFQHSVVFSNIISSFERVGILRNLSTNPPSAQIDEIRKSNLIACNTVETVPQSFSTTPTGKVRMHKQFGFANKAQIKAKK
jgi:hypothetical protein